VADAQDFGLDQNFNTVVAGEVIEHLEDPGRFLACARQHLAPGGRIVLSTAQPFALMNIAYAWYNFPKTCSTPTYALALSTDARRAGRTYGLPDNAMGPVREHSGGGTPTHAIDGSSGWLRDSIAGTDAGYCSSQCSSPSTSRMSEMQPIHNLPEHSGSERVPGAREPVSSPFSLRRTLPDIE
jgi:hypothetical protein